MNEIINSASVAFSWWNLEVRSKQRIERNLEIPFPQTGFFMDHGRSVDRWFLGAGQHHMGHGDVEHYWWAIAKGLGCWRVYGKVDSSSFAPGNLIRKTSEFPAVNFFLVNETSNTGFCVNCCDVGGGVWCVEINNKLLNISKKQHGDIMGFFC